MKTNCTPRKTRLAQCIGSLLILGSQAAFADDIRTLPTVEVVSRYSLLGVGDTANEGAAGQFQIDNRVVARTGEVLEVVPGLIVSQHSGEGKANQYFLRGFNLDHGIDFKMSLDGMPINQRSHAHGQGWADLNPLIPELISSIHYRKGPYYAAEGDFANAGSANIYYTDKIDRGLASFGLGQNGYYRTLLSDAPKFHDGNLLYALELSHYDGPWDNPDNYKKINGLLRYSQGGQANGFNLTAMAYSGKWNSTDQIPWNEYKRGLISRWGAMDPSSGATAHRYSLSGEWRQSDSEGSTLVQAYVINNYLDLYSNFEYGADSQFNQRDSRVTTGLNASRTFNLSGLGKEAANTIGIQVQHDQIRNGLYSSRQRSRIDCNTDVIEQCRGDRIGQSSVGLYAENHVHWNDWFRTVAGLRGDYFRFANTGLYSSTGDNNTATVNDFIATPKLNVIFGPWSKTEYYYSVGNGYHSNDARGVTIGSGVRADGLVRTFGQEVGVRTEIIEGLQTTFAVFQLDNASEIVYIGDAGRTEDSGRRSRRTGFEFNNYFKANKWLTIDADFAYSRARFRDAGGDGNYIPGSVEGVASVAAIIDNGGPYSGSLQLRYFGPRPLTEDNSVRSEATTTLNGKLGYRISKDTKVELIGFNLLNSQHSAIDYYSDSYTFNGTGGQSGRVFHPIESRSFRAVLITRF
jgi:outer membrane cobalamin receptor